MTSLNRHCDVKRRATGTFWYQWKEETYLYPLIPGLSGKYQRGKYRAGNKRPGNKKKKKKKKRKKKKKKKKKKEKKKKNLLNDYYFSCKKELWS